MKRTKGTMASRFIGAVFGLCVLAGAIPALAQQPREDVQVSITGSPVSVKHGHYLFDVRVKDRDGKAADDHDVYLQLPGSARGTVQRVKLSRVKAGWYRGQAHQPFGQIGPKVTALVYAR